MSRASLAGSVLALAIAERATAPGSIAARTDVHDLAEPVHRDFVTVFIDEGKPHLLLSAKNTVAFLRHPSPPGVAGSPCATRPPRVRDRIGSWISQDCTGLVGSSGSASKKAIAALQQAIDEGVKSGEPEPFDFKAFKARMRAQHARE